MRTNRRLLRRQISLNWRRCAAPGDSQQVVLESDQPEMEIGLMKKRYTEEQIIGFLREADAGLPVKELCRKHGFSEASYYAWKAKFGGMNVSDAQRLKALEAENGKLKRLLANSMLEVDAMREVLKGK
jgi:putative transposase